MPPEHDSRPEERHHDFTVQTALIARCAMMIGRYLIPLCFAGLLMLVANHFQQQQMAEDMRNMASEIKEMRKEAIYMSHKIAVMWSGGDWERRYKTTE